MLCGDLSVLYEQLASRPARRSVFLPLAHHPSLSLSLLLVIVPATCRSAEGNCFSSFRSFLGTRSDPACRSRGATRAVSGPRFLVPPSVPERANASLSLSLSFCTAVLLPFSLFPLFVSLSPSLVTCRLRNITRATYFRYTPRRAAVFSSRPHCLRPDTAALAQP